MPCRGKRRHGLKPCGPICGSTLAQFSKQEAPFFGQYFFFWAGEWSLPRLVRKTDPCAKVWAHGEPWVLGPQGYGGELPGGARQQAGPKEVIRDRSFIPGMGVKIKPIRPQVKSSMVPSTRASHFWVRMI